MESGKPKQTFTFAEKLSILWLALFSAAALVSQVLLMQGEEVMAVPEQAYLPPFTSPEHLLGTDQLGRDVFFYLFLSCRTAWLLAIPPLVIATIIGVLLGTGAAILGNQGLKIPASKLFKGCLLLFIYLALFQIVHSWPPFQELSFRKWVFNAGFLLLLIFIFSHKGGSPEGKKTKAVKIPVEEGLQKMITIWSSLPKLLLLLILTVFTPFSMITLMGWIGVTYWVLPARVSRATVLQIKKGPYYETAKGLGIPFNRIFITYIMPSLKGPILTNFCFAASGLLGVGSTLAYLGIGIPADVPSWGKMLATARFSVEAWWLLLFPALVLLASIFSLQIIGHRLSSPNLKKSVTK
ncbi:ABC transporter permease subunit [Rufibacter latericius]|uniref:ABC transporter permease subunit n=1 Tax=Rufibacter latericius TaxID=2487040 RepID=A0A3M9MHC4_9BACT|nr:ABC transporter permease subunit [Rufibacter latericius]RNI24970.1 ABC transporter permease subunit [Rufibacter latericius]